MATITKPPEKKSSPNAIIVNQRQKGNPILKHIRNVPWEYGEIIPDYVMGQATCALFLSLRYHQLHPNYIHDRLRQLGRSYALRVLLVQVDVKDPHFILKDLAEMCLLADCTLILAFNVEEAGRYIETYKAYENKPPDAIMERSNDDYFSTLQEVLTSVKSVNKTDVIALITRFKTMDGVIHASEEELAMCPGFGPQKAKRLYTTLHQPFKTSS
ncbi:unnamed protein product [Owenia fusiformis]|uniref:DNA excision repair protein ERCC-1 n=1 Tax=Owenia fusiformis TaxID=6347 RepID=A0A8J1U6G3_OWEFU|nr:unnamed protein product [Owenia fusiformis]